MARSRRPSEQLAPGEYERLLAAQGGHCALCPATPKTRRLHVDHDHQTGQVRGLLCFRCNRFLHSWMTPEWLRGAADYIEVPEPPIPWEVAMRRLTDFARHCDTSHLDKPASTWAEAVRRKAPQR